MMKKALLLIASLVLLIMLAACGAQIDENTPAEPAVKENPLGEAVTIEAGAPMPEASAFLREGFSGKIAGEGVDTTVVGVHDITVTVDGEDYMTTLTVVDTVSPKGETQYVYVTPGGEVQAAEFFTSVDDVTDVKIEFVKDIDTSKTGIFDIELILTDASGNTSTFEERLIVSNLLPVYVEASTEPMAVEQVAPYVEGASLASEFIPDKLGTHIVVVMIGEERNACHVTVTDTTAPQASGVDFAGYVDYPVEAERLVSDVSDVTNVTFEYKTQPDFTKEGETKAIIAVTDEAGNVTEVTSNITLSKDTEAPVLYGLNDHMYFYMGGTISYLSSVYAEDNCCSEEDITIDVDKSAVDIYQLGEYEVIYTATDKFGNSSTKTVIVELVEQTTTQEELDAEVERVLGEITTPEMSMGEKAFAIYNYVRGKMVYINTSNKTDYIGEAYNGLKKLQGDCYTFYASTDALLKAIGADTMMVSRKYNTTRPTNHYWLKVNLGTGWYHMDTCNTGPRNYEAFMRTDDEFTTRAQTFWMFERSLYPASPTTPYEKDF